MNIAQMGVFLSAMHVIQMSDQSNAKTLGFLPTAGLQHPK